MEHFPEQKPDEVQLLSIFPAEIWRIILGNIYDAADYYNLCKSSPYIKQQCEHIRVQTLFPEVATVLYVQLQKYHRDLRQVIAKCRTVCRKWEKGVDAVLHNDKLRNKLKDAALLGILPLLPFEFYFEYFRTRENVESFRRRFDETHAGTNRNPFFCRRVYIECGSILGPEGENMLTCEQTLQLLRVYGHQIWYCLLIVSSDAFLDTTLLHYQHLREMLELMPNLNTLTLSCSHPDLSDLVLEDLRIQAEANPFPKLEHLQYIRFSYAPTPIFNGLLKPNRHVKMLSAHSWNPKGNDILCQETLPELEQLSMDIRGELQLQKIENFEFVWPLRKLSVSVIGSLQATALFKLLKNKWSESLTELTLFLLEEVDLELPALELSKLETFTLQTEYFTPLDFLLACKLSLSSLTVYVKMYSSNVEFQPRLQAALENEKAVRFYGFRNNLINSNIWTLFPKLRSVEYYDWELRMQRQQRTATRRFDWMLKQLENV